MAAEPRDSAASCAMMVVGVGMVVGLMGGSFGAGTALRSNHTESRWRATPFLEYFYSPAKAGPGVTHRDAARIQGSQFPKRSCTSLSLTVLSTPGSALLQAP